MYIGFVSPKTMYQFRFRFENKLLFSVLVSFSAETAKPRNLIFCASSPYPVISFVDCVLNIRPSIELCCLVVFDLSCNVLFRFFFFVLFVFLLLLPLMANKVVCVVSVGL